MSRLRALLLTGLVLAGTGALLQRSPVEFATHETELAAPLPRGTLDTAEVCLVASPERVRERSQKGRDDTFAWVSFLEQEFGPWRLAVPGDEADGGLERQMHGVRLAVVPESAWTDLSPSDRAALANHPTAHILVEGPAARAQSLGGHALAIDDFAAGLARMQQGETGALDREYPGVRSGLVQPHGFLPEGSEPRALAPAADLKERALLADIERMTPIAGWWPFPGGAPAYVAVTHDEERFGDKSAWLPEAFAERGVATTGFIIPDRIGRSGVAAMQAARTDVHLHWDRGFFGEMPLRHMGIGPLAPAVRRSSLLEQVSDSRDLGVVQSDVVMNRTHGLIFDPDPAKTFRMLHAAGVTVDSTYGPSGPDRFGYLFGTGLPFRPLDATGWPFPLVEVPFLFQEDEAWSRDDQDRIIREAASTHHQLVVGVYHTNSMSRVPSAELIEGMLAVGESARTAGADHGSLERFIRHWNARLRSRLTTTVHDGVVRVAANAALAGLSVRLPADAAGDVLVDGVLTPPVRHGPYIVVPLPHGEHTVEVVYR